jgi:serine/threonine protein kinase/tetratricopeptide (TPR) repeat protein
MIEHDKTLDERFSDAWSHQGDGPAPSVAEFLANYPAASPGERLDVLLADQMLRWRRDCPKSVGEYLAEHPDLASDSEAILKLVQGEFLARLEREEVPDPGSYMRMFPDLAEEIRLQCEVDHWLTIPMPSGQSMATTVDYRSSDPADEAQAEDQTEDGTRGPEWEPPQDQDAPMRESDFQLVRRLGSGGMGEVYEAIQKSLRKRVALKLIKREALDSPSRVRRFFAEARALARLHHPQIVGVHGIGRMTDGRYFLVMDLVEPGTTLSDLIQAGPVPFDRAAELVATVAEAIAHAHSRSVIHRDLKPSNVLLDAVGNPHVTDFGLAKVFDATDPDHPQTTADQVLGTPHYMPPEQADPARGPITPRTDVYALGGLLFALLTGQPPIQGDSLTALLTQVISPEPVPSPREVRGEIPPALEQICRTCLEKGSDKRYASAGAVAAALRSWLANPDRRDLTSVPAGSPERSPGSSTEPGPGGSRRDWVPDRSWKDERRPTDPGRWTARSAPAPRSRRRLAWMAGAGASTLALLCLMVTFVHFQGRVHRRHDPARPLAAPMPLAGPSEKPTSLPPIAEASSDLAHDLQDQGNRLNARGRYAEAEPHFRKALELRLKVLGEDHADTLGSWNNLALNLEAQGKHAEAEPLFHKALEASRKMLGENSPLTAECYNHVALNLNAQGKSAEAEPLLRKALIIRLKALGEDHADTAASYNNLALNLQAQGKSAEAASLHRQVLAIRLKTLGEDHPDTLQSRKNLATASSAAGRSAVRRPETALVRNKEQPRDVVIELPERIEKGTSNLLVRATATPPPGGIKEVAFFFGTEADFDKAAAAGQVVKAQPIDPDGRNWTATLPVPKGESGKLVVTARFKTAVGLTVFAPATEVAVTEPPPEEEKTALAAPPRPGTIEGIIKEGDQPQAHLDVYLIDPATPGGQPGVRKAKTDAGGAFSFKDLEPKQYRLYCEKRAGATNRKADQSVRVESGQTVKVSLELLR